MTNQIPYLGDAIRWSEGLYNAPAAVLVFLFCIASGYVWRAIKVFPNRYTPLAVMVAGAILLTGMDWVSKPTAPAVIRSASIGFIIGFLAWLLHRLLIKRVEDWLGSKLGDDPEFLDKPATETPKDPT